MWVRALYKGRRREKARVVVRASVVCGREIHPIADWDVTRLRLQSQYSGALLRCRMALCSARLRRLLAWLRRFRLLAVTRSTYA